MNQPIYLDYNATTPVDERVLQRMLPYFSETFGNPSSKGHPYGWAAEEAVEHARAQVATLLGADADGVVFTGGATEALNTALKGVFAAYRTKGRHVVTVATEHSAVLDTCRTLERAGADVTYLPVQASGLVDPDELEAALMDETILVAVMWANNETGVLQPIPEIAQRTRERGILFLSDATQACGKVPVDVRHVDLLACSAHKLYGPKGTGALYLSRRGPRVRIAPLIDGGGQERGLRGGTLNTPGIVGFGAAAAIASQGLTDESARLERLRDGLEARLLDAVPDVTVNGRTAPRLPQTTNVTFSGVDASKLVAALRGLAVSTGSACSSGSGRPSHVLTAMGQTPDDARSSLRLSLGRFTTEADVEQAAEQIIDAVRGLRATRAAGAASTSTR